MSNYNFKAKNKETGEIFEVSALDNHFGHHKYGYNVHEIEVIYNEERFYEYYEEVKEETICHKESGGEEIEESKIEVKHANHNCGKTQCDVVEVTIKTPIRDRFNHLIHTDEDVRFVLSKMRAKLGDVAINDMLETFYNFLFKEILQAKKDREEEIVGISEKLKKEGSLPFEIEENMQTPVENGLFKSGYNKALSDLIESIKGK